MEIFRKIVEERKLNFVTYKFPLMTFELRSWIFNDTKRLLHYNVSGCRKFYIYRLINLSTSNRKGVGLTDKT